MANDIALNMLITASDLATPGLAAVDASIGSVTVALDAANVSMAQSSAYLATLGDQAFTTGVGFDGMAASMTSVDASLGSVDASAAATSASLDTVAVSADTANSALKGIAIGLGVVALAAVGVGVVSAKMAGDFQASITKLYTTAGEAKSNLQMVSDGILSMSASVGTSAQQLVQAMYWVESGGLHGAAALEALRVAAQAAKAENANLDSVSIALAASLNAYAGSGMTAVQVMNTLTAATGQGMMTFEQLSGSLASVLPASAKFGISLADVTAAMATMTAQGDPAANAATHLRQMILSLEAPSKIGAAALQSVGLSSEQVAAEMKVSLPGAIQMITDAVGKKFPEGSAAYNQAIKDIAGGSKQMMGFLELSGSHLDTFAANLVKISAAVKAGGNDLMGWADIQKNFNFQVDAAKAALDALMITLGLKLLPTLTSIVQYGIVPFINNLTYIVQHGSDLVAFFQSASAGATALKIAFAVLAIAVASVKIANIVTDMSNFISAVPGMVAKIYLVQEAADGVAASKGLGAIAPAAAKAADGVATSTAAMKLSLAGVVTGIGLVLLAEIGLAKWLRDNNIVPKAGNNQPDWVTHHNPADDLKKAADQAKALDTQIKTAWSDMASLYDYAHSHNNILGDLADPLALNKTDIKLQEMKTHLDDLAKPYEPQIITASIEAGRLKVIDFKTHADDLTGPVNVGVLTSQVDAGRLKVIEFKTHVDDLAVPVTIQTRLDQLASASVAAVTARKRIDELGVPVTPIVLTPHITAATVAAMDTKTHLDDLVGPVDILTGIRGITTATVAAMDTKTHLDDLVGPTDILTNTGGITAATVAAMTTKTHLDDLIGPVTPGVLTPQITAATAAAMVTKTHLDDLIGPVTPGVSTGSIDAASVAAMTLKTHLDDLTAVINVPVNIHVSGQTGIGGFTPGFASGVENFGGGLAYVHQGEVLMNLSPGTSVIPANRVSFNTANNSGGNIYITAVGSTKEQIQQISDAIDKKWGRNYRRQYGPVANGGGTL